MNFDLAEKIANAVLYEGYLLYPYRPSAAKNQRRWTFGTIYPQAYSVALQGAEPWSMQTECLITGDDDTTLTVKTRFLQLILRQTGELDHALENLPEDTELAFRRIESPDEWEKVAPSWQEAVERELTFTDLNLAELLDQPQYWPFEFLAQERIEPAVDATGQVVGVIRRRQEKIAGRVELIVQQPRSRVFKLTLRILNQTRLADAGTQTRDEASLWAFVSTHMLLGVSAGECVSLMDPPKALRDLTAGCRNIGTYPVLVGAEGTHAGLLSSPIILYDYPQVAPESAGDLFDGTEIDEILMLRILTLTDEEKEEMRLADDRARELLDRTEALPPEIFMRLHGALRDIHST